MSVNNINPNLGVQQTGRAAATGGAENVGAEEGLFETPETTNVKNVADVAYVEEELGVLESIGEKIGLDLTGDLETDFDALNEYPGKLDEMLEK